MSTIYRLINVVKTRAIDGGGFRIVIPSLTVREKEVIAVVGYSGSGKSTLLDMLAMILRPDEAWTFEFSPRGGGTTNVGETWARNQQNRLSDLRKQHIGYVLQTGGLLPYLTVRQNIDLPRRLLDLPKNQTVERLSRDLGIHRHLDKLPGLLSAGERQRVAFARALAHQPSVVIADEPTASLDPITARKIMAAVMELVKELGVTLITASHDWAHIYKLDFRSLHQESVEKKDGKLIESIFKD